MLSSQTISKTSLKDSKKDSEANVPTVFVIFGVTGDLSQRKLLPSLFDLYSKDILPEKLKIVGFARRDWSDSDFQRFTKEAITEANQLSKQKKESIPKFLEHLTYVRGNFNEAEAYKAIEEKTKLIEKEFGQCPNKLFHLAVPPSLYETILNFLADSTLTEPCGGELGWSRVLVEKPFGSDTKTSLKLDKMLGKLFKEEQIFRIDHYLAKETLQNICYFRFSNVIFEPLWNKKYVDRIEIALLEELDVSGRGAFYDEVGALRDVGQNHLLQMLALIAMERPTDFHSEPLRKERAKVLSKIKNLSPSKIKEGVSRGQYEGFQKEEGVRTDSRTETYFKIKAFIENRRWQGVPFYLESGKALERSEAYIKVFFKNSHSTRNSQGENKEGLNELVFLIQPNEGIEIHFWVKEPGFEAKLKEKTLSYFYNTQPEAIPGDYEKLLFDCIKGDQTLFASTNEIQASWKFITSILDNWQSAPLHQYQRGANPKEVAKKN